VFSRIKENAFPTGEERKETPNSRQQSLPEAYAATTEGRGLFALEVLQNPDGEAKSRNPPERQIAQEVQRQ